MKNYCYIYHVVLLFLSSLFNRQFVLVNCTFIYKQLIKINDMINKLKTNLQSKGFYKIKVG